MGFVFTSETAEQLHQQAEQDQNRSSQVRSAQAAAPRTAFTAFQQGFQSNLPQSAGGTLPAPLELGRIDQQRQQRPISQGGTMPTPFELADIHIGQDEQRRRALMLDLQNSPPTETNRNRPGYIEDPRITELRDLDGQTPDLISGIQSINPRPLIEGAISARPRALNLVQEGIQELRRLSGRDVGTVLTKPDPTDPQVQQSLATIQRSLEAGVDITRGASFAGLGVDPQSVTERPFAALSGREFLELTMRNHTFGEVGLADINLGEDTTPRLVNELLEALAPVNFLIAGTGSTASASLRALAAAPGRSRSARLTLQTMAGAIEPFAGKGAPALAREIGADVAAQEAFARTEDSPLALRLAAGAAAGAIAGFSPEIASASARLGARTAYDLPNLPPAILENARHIADVTARTTGITPDPDALLRADPTMISRDAGSLHPGAVLPVEYRGEVRSVRVVAGAADEPDAFQIFRLRESDNGYVLGADQFTDNPDRAASFLTRAEAEEYAARHPGSFEVEEVSFTTGDRPAGDARPARGPRAVEASARAEDEAALRSIGDEGPQRELDEFALEEPTQPTLFDDAATGDPETEIRRLQELERQSRPVIPQSRLSELERARLKEWREFNRQDLSEANALRRESDNALRRQANAQNAEEARLFREQFNLRAKLDETVPNSEQLRLRVKEILDQPIPTTPKGEVPVGESGKVTGDAGPAPYPNVPPEMREVVEETIDSWLKTSDAILDQMSVGGNVVLRTIQAQLSGTISSPFLAEGIYQSINLRNALINAGVSDRVAKLVSDAALDQHLARRFGDGFVEIRAARPRIASDIAAEMAVAREQIIDPKAVDLATNNRIKELYGERLGNAAVVAERNVHEQLAAVNATAGLTGVRKFVQRIKNTIFAIDASVFGVQGIAAVYRGGVPMLAKWFNDLLAGLHVPHVRLAYAQANTSKQIQYTIDGLDLTAASSALRPGEGSLLDWVPGLNTKIPGIDQSVADGYTRIADKLNDLQFGTAMTWLRTQAYEGDLIMLHLLGRDISDPLVRMRAARHANHVGSSSRPALTASRREFEDAALTSARMTRARFNNIIEMAKVLTANNREDRILGATTIMSAVGVTLGAGQVLNNLVGIDDFEWDPSQPGFGLITLPTGRIIDVIPQDSVTRAFADSIDELKNGDPKEATKAWAKMFLGSASPVARVIPLALRTGFEPGAGFRFGDLTLEGAALNLAPLPPVVMNGITEGWDSAGTALDLIGIANFPESSFSARNRALEDAGIDKDALSSTQENAQLAETYGLDVVEEFEERRVGELQELADRGDRKSKALLLSAELRDKLTGIADRIQESPGGSKAEYREARKAEILKHIGRQSEYDDIFRSFATSENPAEALAGQRYALRDTIEDTSPDYFDRIEELEQQFDAQLNPSERDAMMAVINAVNVLDHPWEQEYDVLLQDLGASDWWNLKDDVWSTAGFADTLGFPTLDAAERDFTSRITSQALSLGLSPGRAREEAIEGWQASDVKSSFDELVKLERERWVTADIAHARLADQMLEWGLWSNVPVSVEEYLDLLSLGAE